MMSKTFLDASIPELVADLKFEEKITLLGGRDWWNTSSIQRLGIPSVRMSDGPNGVRGSSQFLPIPGQCLPCPTSLASTFDLDLIYDVGVFLGQEAKFKSSVILLAPTCNIQRNPLGGRAFESFSEDPHLSGTLAAAYIKGLQSEGVSAAIRHFVGNDQEHERTAASSVVSPRALREVYLYPFMLAQKYGRPGAFETSYGRINGTHCSENKELLTGILRNEWGFDGITISDWYGTCGVDQPINAGLDLEMPGPARWRRSDLVLFCISSRKLFFRTINERVTNFLTFVQKLARRNPEIVFGDGVERSRDTPEARKFARKVAADGTVLLKNKDNLLPLTPGKVKTLAVIGPNARQAIISGGGSAALTPTYVVTPLEGLRSNAPDDLTITYEVGCYTHKYLPTLEDNMITPAGGRGWHCTFYNHNEDGSLGDPVQSFILNLTRVIMNDFTLEALTPTWSIKLRGKLKVDQTCLFELGLTVAGRAKLWIDGKLTIDNWTKQTPGDFFYGQGTIEERATIEVAAGTEYDVLIEYINTFPPGADDDKDDGRLSQPVMMRGVRLGGRERIDAEKAIEAAISLAGRVDAVLIVGGLTPEWEGEGFDRSTLRIPGRQDELITRVSAVNPKTIVCIQAGSAVSMPWVNSVSGIIQAWYAGNEAGNAIADIVYGKVNPSGRLSLTLPRCEEDIPAWLNRRSENGNIHYREDLFIGYKHYQARNIKPLFPFGFGLSYTTFALSTLGLRQSPSEDETFALEISITVKNTGEVSGSEVVQVYIAYPDIGVTTPRLQLKGFAKAKDLAPGATQNSVVKLGKYAVSIWDAEQDSWRVAAGRYEVQVGTSSENLPLKDVFELKQGFSWKGL